MRLFFNELKHVVTLGKKRKHFDLCEQFSANLKDSLNPGKVAPDEVYMTSKEMN